MPIQSTTATIDAQPLDAKMARINVSGLEVSQITYKGEPVITFAEVDRIHSRRAETASRSFRDNRGHFTEGVDFIVPTSLEIRGMCEAGILPDRTARVTFVTRRGYLKLCKSLNDPLAWERFDDMLDVYFGAKDVPAVVESPAFKVPTTLREALLFAAAQEAEIERQRALADAATAKAIEMERTKAEIGSKREATAMNAARWAKDRASKLEIELDRSNSYATVKRMEIAFGRKFPWHPLKKASVAMGLEIRVVPDPNFDSVKSYHALAWREAYGIDVPGWDGTVGDGDAP